uniref:G protein-coupled receptor n=1 Tax=Brugia timori TaxID=42155 RepID=A0A0R3QYZ2_9BILA
LSSGKISSRNIRPQTFIFSLFVVYFIYIRICPFLSILNTLPSINFALAFSTIDYYFCIRSFHVSDLHWIRDCTKRPKSIFTRSNLCYSLHMVISVTYCNNSAITILTQRKAKITSDFPTNRSNKSKGFYKMNLMDRIVNSSMSIKRKLNMARNNIYERSMLVQAALTCGVFEIKLIIVYLLPPLIIKIFGEGAHIPLRIFINCYIIFIYAALPTVYFLCNNRARRILKHHFFQLRHQHLNDQFVELRDQHFKDQHNLLFKQRNFSHKTMGFAKV